MSLLSIEDVIDYCQTEALANKLSPTEESVYRYFCREYSKTFNTPLAEVKAMDVMEVIREVYEERYSDMNVDDNLEEIFETIYGLEDPDYAKTKASELKDFIRHAEEEEDIRQELGRPIHRALADETSIKNSLPEDPPPPPTKMPLSGGINLSYLEKEESEGNFDDE